MTFPSLGTIEFEANLLIIGEDCIEEKYPSEGSDLSAKEEKGGTDLFVELLGEEVVCWSVVVLESS